MARFLPWVTETGRPSHLELLPKRFSLIFANRSVTLFCLCSNLSRFFIFFYSLSTFKVTHSLGKDFHADKSNCSYYTLSLSLSLFLSIYLSIYLCLLQKIYFFLSLSFSFSLRYSTLSSHTFGILLFYLSYHLFLKYRLLLMPLSYTHTRAKFLFFSIYRFLPKKKHLTSDKNVSESQCRAILMIKIFPIICVMNAVDRWQKLQPTFTTLTILKVLNVCLDS